MFNLSPFILVMLFSAHAESSAIENCGQVFTVVSDVRRSSANSDLGLFLDNGNQIFGKPEVSLAAYLIHEARRLHGFEFVVDASLRSRGLAGQSEGVKISLLPNFLDEPHLPTLAHEIMHSLVTKEGNIAQTMSFRPSGELYRLFQDRKILRYYRNGFRADEAEASFAELLFGTVKEQRRSLKKLQLFIYAQRELLEAMMLQTQFGTGIYSTEIQLVGGGTITISIPRIDEARYVQPHGRWRNVSLEEVRIYFFPIFKERLGQLNQLEKSLEELI